MSGQHGFGTELLVGLAALALGCGGTMDTGTAKRPVNNKPAEDGSCPSGQSLCGTGVFAICVDLQHDPHHCGTCEGTCSPGIACQAGVCRQTVCTAAAVPFSGQPTTTAPPKDLPTTPRNTLADVNGDGRLDLVEWQVPAVFPPPDLAAFRVSLGQPGGGFGAPESYRASTNVSSVVAVDVNGDGADDLWVFAENYENAVIRTYRVELWLGSRDGTLIRSEAPGGSGGLVTPPMGTGDLSGDGWPDLVLQTPVEDYDNPPSINVYLSDSTGALHLSQTYAMGWGEIGTTIVKDWNRDGSPDLVVMADGVQILYNRGDGSFAPPVTCGVALGGAFGMDIVVEDFNHDGHWDVAQDALGSGSRILVLLGLGGCGFAPMAYYDVPGTFSSGPLRAVDMNGDGQLDLVKVSGLFTIPTTGAPVLQDQLLSVLLGNPDGTFQPAGAGISLGLDAAEIAIGEVTGDERPDVVVTSSDGQARTWENACQ